MRLEQASRTSPSDHHGADWVTSLNFSQNVLSIVRFDFASSLELENLGSRSLCHRLCSSLTIRSGKWGFNSFQRWKSGLTDELRYPPSFSNVPQIRLASPALPSRRVKDQPVPSQLGSCHPRVYDPSRYLFLRSLTLVLIATHKYRWINAGRKHVDRIKSSPLAFQIIHSRL